MYVVLHLYYSYVVKLVKVKPSRKTFLSILVHLESENQLPGHEKSFVHRGLGKHYEPPVSYLFIRNCVTRIEPYILSEGFTLTSGCCCIVFYNIGTIEM